MADTKKLLLPLLVVVLGLIAAFVLIASRPTVEKTSPIIVPPTVRILTVQPETIPVTVRSQGSVVPRTEATLVAEVSGRIDRVAQRFEAGEFIRAGQPLLWIDGRDYQAALAGQQASLAQAKVVLERERAESEVARAEWEALGRSGTPNPLVLRKPQLLEAQARVDAAKATVQRAELDLERTVVRAPFAGRIRSTAIDQGGFVNRGTPLATVYSVERAEVRLPVADGELAFLKEASSFDSTRSGSGSPVTLTALYAGQQRTWQGRIVRSEGVIDPSTRMVYLIAQVEDPYGLRSSIEAPFGVGLFVEAAIEGIPVANAYRVPRSALRRGSTSDTADTVLLVENDRLITRRVHVLRATKDTLIIDAGLEPGDSVVISKLDIATNGMTVKPLPIESRSRGEGASHLNDTSHPELSTAPTTETQP